MSKLTIRQATAEDVQQFYGRNPYRTMWGFVLVDGDAVVGISGVYADGNYRMVFSDMKDEIHARKKDIIRMAKVTMAAIEARGKSVIAIASPTEKNARVFIQHFGFTHVESSALGEIYSWTPGGNHD